MKRSDYECEYVVTEWDVKLYQLAKEYHERCEAYDRTVCTGGIREGMIVPSCHAEFVLINRNAEKVIKDICERNSQFIRQEILRAISMFDNYVKENIK